MSRQPLGPLKEAPGGLSAYHLQRPNIRRIIPSHTEVNVGVPVIDFSISLFQIEGDFLLYQMTCVSYSYRSTAGTPELLIRPRASVHGESAILSRSAAGLSFSSLLLF